MSLLECIIEQRREAHAEAVATLQEAIRQTSELPEFIWRDDYYGIAVDMISA